MNLLPSVTTIGNIKAKFALTNWLQEEAAMVASDMTASEMNDAYQHGYPNDVCESWTVDREWAKTVVAASRDKTMEKADAGTAIHAILEHYFCEYRVSGTGNFTDDGFKMCETVDSCIYEHTSYTGEWKAEARFCDTENGFAGMCDLHNDDWVIDFKTKDTVDDKTRGWPEQAEQLAAYAHGLGVPNARLANVFISREDPTQVVWFEHKNTDHAWLRFIHAVHLWSVEKKYGPYWKSIK